MANFGTFLALASYSRHRNTNEDEQHSSGKKSQSQDSVKLVAMLQMFLSMALTFYTWYVVYCQMKVSVTL